jgi:hypothetical protein
MTTTSTPINSAALSAALRAHGEEASSMALRLVCDLLADMPEELACAYAGRVRELADARACKVADMLDAYRAATTRTWASRGDQQPVREERTMRDFDRRHADILREADEEAAEHRVARKRQRDEVRDYMRTTDWLAEMDARDAADED